MRKSPLIIGIVVILMVLASILASTASAYEGPPYCGSSLGDGRPVPYTAKFDAQGNLDLSDFSDISSSELSERGIQVGRIQYTDRAGLPYAAPVLSWVSSDGQIVVLRAGCGWYQSWIQIEGFVRWGNTFQPISPGLVRWTISPSGEYLFVELSYDVTVDSQLLLTFRDSDNTESSPTGLSPRDVLMERYVISFSKR